MRLAKAISTVLLAVATSTAASAQSFERIFQDSGQLGQSQRAAIRAEWEKISPGEILCVDNRLRRARRSVNTLIDRGIGPTDNRVTGIVSDCRASRNPDSSNVAATPSFNCLVANQPDELAICATPELARLDRAVVEGYERMLRTDGSGAAKSLVEPLLNRRHACGADIDCIKRVQLTAIAAFQARGKPVQAQGEKAAYSVAGMKLGNNVGIGSAEYSDYTCAPTKQYSGFTGCQRQIAERSRRRRILESTSFLHAADGSAVYINQNLEPVSMDERDAHAEIRRLSETLGKATLLAMPPTRGLPSGLIASWGEVSLQPLDSAHMAELAAGTGDIIGILVDPIGNPQRSAQLGLPIYRLGGSAGYVWSASWNGRGRGALRMLAIDASRLPGAVVEANPSADQRAITSHPPAPTVVTGAPTPSPPDGPRAAAATQPAPSVAAPSAQKSIEPAAVVAREAKSPAVVSPPANVRVVGPPIALRPTASAVTPTPMPTSAGSASGSGLVIFLIALIPVLIGAIGYLLRKSRVAMPAAVAAAPLPAKPHEDVVSKPQKIDLPALVPAESPASVVGFATAMEAPHTEEAMPRAEMGKHPGGGDTSRAS